MWAWVLLVFSGLQFYGLGVWGFGFYGSLLNFLGFCGIMGGGGSRIKDTFFEAAYYKDFHTLAVENRIPRFN